MPDTTSAVPSAHMSWRTPLLVILAGCAVSLITFGPRDFHAVLKAKFGLNDR